jgi:DNA mismatch repair protein MLH1
MMYQAILKDFHNFGVIDVQPSMPLTNVLEMALEFDSEIDPNDRHEAASQFTKRLEARESMFREYFNVRFDDGALTRLPLVIPNYTPAMEKLPRFLLDMATKVRDGLLVFTARLIIRRKRRALRG